MFIKSNHLPGFQRLYTPRRTLVNEEVEPRLFFFLFELDQIGSSHFCPLLHENKFKMLEFLIYETTFDLLKNWSGLFFFFFCLFIFTDKNMGQDYKMKDRHLLVLSTLVSSSSMVRLLLSMDSLVSFLMLFCAALFALFIVERAFWILI